MDTLSTPKHLSIFLPDSLSDVLDGLAFIHEIAIQSLYKVGFNFTVLSAKITDDFLVELFCLLTHGKGDLGIAEMIVQQPADQTRGIEAGLVHPRILVFPDQDVDSLKLGVLLWHDICEYA